jgi:hypothetical protein
MLNFQFFPPDNADFEGVLKVTVPENATAFLAPEEFPLRFLIHSASNRTVWDTDLFPGMWSAYAYITFTSAQVLTAKGQRLLEWKWDPFEHGDLCHQAFALWALQNPGAKGIAIGTHDGTSGEWVGPVLQGKLQAVLVEPSSKQFGELFHLYSRKTWVTLVQTAITPDGGNVEFYEAGEGHTNSVNPEHLKKYLPSLPVSSQTISSLTFAELCEKTDTKPRWLHLDVEDLDDKILFSIPEHLMPECIVYEHENLTLDREHAVHEWAESHHFRHYKSGRNTICFKTPS